MNFSLNYEEVVKEILGNDVETKIDDGVKIRYKRDGFTLGFPPFFLEFESQQEVDAVKARLKDILPKIFECHKKCVGTSWENIKSKVTIAFKGKDILYSGNPVTKKFLDIYMIFKIDDRVLDYTIHQTDLKIWGINEKELQQTASQMLIDKYNRNKVKIIDGSCLTERLHGLLGEAAANAFTPRIIFTKEMGPEFILIPEVLKEITEEYNIGTFMILTHGILGFSKDIMFGHVAHDSARTAFKNVLLSPTVYTYDKKRNGIAIVK